MENLFWICIAGCIFCSLLTGLFQARLDSPTTTSSGRLVDEATPGGEDNANVDIDRVSLGQVETALSASRIKAENVQTDGQRNYLVHKEAAEPEVHSNADNSKESSAVEVETEKAEQRPEAGKIFETAIGSSPLVSTVHCVGETFTEKAWTHRSCEFTNICFDRKRKDFVLFKPEASPGHHHQGGTNVSSSSSYDLSLSLGGINPWWGHVEEGGASKN